MTTSHARPGGHQPLRAIALAVSLQLMGSSYALAAGGKGGEGGYFTIISGGVGGPDGYPGQPGQMPTPDEHGSGGGGGGRGAAGGAGSGWAGPFPPGWTQAAGGWAGIVPGQAGGNGGNGWQDPTGSTWPGAGGGGGGGGADGRHAAGDLSLSSQFIGGGNGGKGGDGGGWNPIPDGGRFGGGGGGGAGGHGLVQDGGVVELLGTAVVRGGNGGAGGIGGGYREQPNRVGGGGGGDGGAGVVTTAPTTIRLGAGASIAGGNGGAGGAGETVLDAAYGPNGGNGGNGGVGLDLASGSTVINDGAIAGGQGGGGGAGSGDVSPGNPGVGGMGAVGIRGANLTVINNGTIAGSSGIAILFTSGTNRLELLGAPSSIYGAVLASGGNDTLAFGGTVDRSVNINAIAASFSGFERLEKTGGFTLTLTSSNPSLPAWQINQGTLAVSSDASLGAASHPVGMDGGALRATATMTTARATNLGPAGGTLDVVSGATLTHDGVISGTGSLTKQGAGRLVLTNTNTYSGGTVIDGGEVDARAVSLGTGAVTVNSGTLAITEGFDGGSRDIDNNAGTLHLYDTGTLNRATVQNTTGTLVLHDNATAADATILNRGGTLSFEDGSTAANSRITTDTGGLTAFAGTSSPANATLIANDSGRVDVSATQGPALDHRLSAASIAGSGRFLLGQNRLTVGGDNRSTEVSGTLEDGGAAGGIGGGLTKTGTGTLLLNGINTYTGTTDIVGGTLVVGDAAHAQARVAGPVNVGTGATLGGHGTVGSTVVASGATLAPGNSIGTLTVAGDLRLEAGSTYRIEADPASAASDRVVVTGTATLDGAAMHVGPDGNFAPTRIYTIVSAGTLLGRFASVTSNYAFLDPRLDYGAHDVTLELTRKDVPIDPSNPGDPSPGNTPDTPGTPTRPIRFADAARSGNQRAAANALDTLPASNALHQSVLTLPTGAPPAVFDSLSGEVHASTTTALIALAGNARTLPLAHLRANLAAGMLPGAPIAQAGGTLPAAALPVSGAQPLWVEVLGNWQTFNGDGNAARMRQQTGGFYAGADGALAGGWRAGGAFGYANSTARVAERAARAIADSYSAVLYGGKAFEVGAGKANLMFGAAYSWHDLDTDRQATVSGASQTLKADYHASTAQVFSELGYALPVAANANVEPYAGLAWSQTRTRGFAETGGNAALHGGGDRNDLTTTTVGMRTRVAFDLGGTQGALHAGAGWRHAFGDVRPLSTLAFDGSQSFSVTGAPIARNAGVIELRADLALSRTATVGLRYAGQFGDGNRDNTATVAMRWRY